MKYLLLLLVFLTVSVYAADTKVSGSLQFRRITESNLDHTSNTKGDVQAHQTEYRTYANIAIDSKINDALSGRVNVKIPNKAKWGFDNTANMATAADADGGTNGGPGDGGSILKVYEAYFDYQPIKNLHFKLGRQTFNYGNNKVIGDNVGAYSQTGFTLSYEMDKYFKVDYMYAIMDENRFTATTYDDKNANVPDETFKAIWAHTGMVPFLQDVNVFYAMDTDYGTLTDEKDSQDRLTTMGIYAAGNAPVGPVKLNYSFQYYKNGGKNEQQPAANDPDMKYEGSLMGFDIGATMADMFGANFGFGYLNVSGGKSKTDKQEGYQTIHSGDTLYLLDSLFASGLEDTDLHDGGANTSYGASAGIKLMRFYVGAVPMKDFAVNLQYLMYDADEKEGIGTAGASKEDIGKRWVLTLDYTAVENLAFKFMIGKEKLSNTYAATATGTGLGKDGNTMTQLRATYTF